MVSGPVQPVGIYDHLGEDTSDAVRGIIESGHYTDLATNPYFSTSDFKAVPAKYRALIPNYIKDYVSLNQFAP